MKKRYLIAIIVLVVLTLCLGVGLAFTYFFTDTFKSNKELFSKYIVQNVEVTELFNDKDLKAYSEKQNNTPYTSEGSIKTNITFPDSSQAQMATALQNCNITFTGKTDKANNYIYQNINANYSDSQSLNLELLQNNDIYAFKINDVINKFIGIQNTNLKDLATKFGLDEETVVQIPDKIDLSEYTSLNLFTNEESEQIKDKYTKIILDNLTDDMFSKETIDDSTTYTLTINKNQCKNIVLKLLETLKDDELILNKAKYLMFNKLNLTEENVNTYIEHYKTLIQSLLDKENEQVANETVLISETQSNSQVLVKIHVEKGNLVKTEIEFPETTSSNSADNSYLNDLVADESLLPTSIDIHKLSIIKSNNGVRFEFELSGSEKTFSISMQKIKSANEIKYDFSAANGDEQLFELIIDFNGIDTNQVHEISELNFEYNDTKFVCTYKNTKNLDSKFSRDDVLNENVMLINSAPNADSITNLFSQIVTRLQQVNIEKTAYLGLQSNDNPFIYYIPSAIPAILTNFISNIN